MTRYSPREFLQAVKGGEIPENAPIKAESKRGREYPGTFVSATPDEILILEPDEKVYRLKVSRLAAVVLL